MAPLEDEERRELFNNLLAELTALERSGEIRTFVAEPLRYLLLKLCHHEILSEEELDGLYRFSASSSLNDIEIKWSANTLYLAKETQRSLAAIEILAQAAAYQQTTESGNGCLYWTLLIMCWIFLIPAIAITKVNPPLAFLLYIIAIILFFALKANS